MTLEDIREALATGGLSLVVEPPDDEPPAPQHDSNGAKDRETEARHPA
jgi:hypothetical protein